ncbi:hypothetical protein CRM22_005070 [Opisthorchis felineus]|uniref:Cadherin domain-containing protein n=1 Tax=Opisthorchis felineus TaxID=147828 RepID=A0A4V6RH08_OPIFE|nr:hypothetical protein CRM22_005070 [Opisthorchis felineus]
MASCSCLACIVSVLLVITPLSEPMPGSFPDKKPLHFINYTVIEESPTPAVLGNLVADLQLNEWMLRNSPIANKEDQKTPSPQLLSIDLIANPGRVTSMISSQEFSETTPHIRLFPSTQWAVPYFVIRFKTSLVQELVLNRPIDRDHVCQTVTTHERNANSDDQCQCFRDQCPKLIEEGSSAQCEFRLTVTVYPLQPANVKFYMVKIILADVNDNAPVFELPNMEYHIFFKEDDPRGTARQLPTASDRDFCFNGQVEYSLLWTQVKDSKLFTLTWSNNSRLELALKEGLDRETEHQYRLYLLAHDSGPIPTRHTTTLPLLITVEDANDCRPTFIRKNQHISSPPCLPVNVEAPKLQPLVVSVPEDLSPGSLVYRIHAVDGDVGENAKVSYHFGPRVHPLSRRIFSLNSSTGELRTQYSLDREQTPLHRDHHRLIVIAKDGGKPSRSSSLLVLVRLLDTNDNYPRMHLEDYGSQPMYNQPGVLRQLTEQSAKLWSGSTSFAGDQWTSLPVNFDLIGIQEPEKVIASLVVDDLDLKENGTVSCQLDRQLVRLRQAGEERLREKAVARLKPLLGKYGRILVEKRSNRWMHTSPMLQPPAVENERMAIWNETQAKAYVIETSLRLIPSSISHLYLRIRCHDYGNPRLSSERTLHLRLWAEEDIKPRFNELEILSDAITPHCGTGLVPKNGQKIQLQSDKGSSNFVDAVVPTACLTLSYAVESGTVLFRVDADSPKLSNPNYVIQYRIDNDNTTDAASYFAIAADKGTVSLRRSLPRLPSRQVMLDIYASIEGAFIQSETTGSAPHTGFLKSRLRIVLRLDYPDATEIELRHIIRNSDGKLEVEVLREPYLNFDISENASVGTRVMGTSALGCVDRGTESWSNACQLQLVERKNDGKFQHANEFKLSLVSSLNFDLMTYTLVTVATLDREQKSVYSLRVTAVGPTPIVPQLYILVHVLDANDNRPQLQAPFEKLTVTLAEYLNSQDITRLEQHSTEVPYIVNISFSFKEPLGWVILRIPATDADVADNAKLAYFIQYAYTRDKDGHFSRRNQNMFYQLDQESGSLTVSKVMTRETLGSYLIKVAVRDHGQPEPLSTSAWIYLHVLDIPPFQQPVNDLPQINQRILTPDSLSINELAASHISPSPSAWDGSGFVQSFWNQKHGKYIIGLFALLLLLLVSCPTFFIWLAYWKRVKLTGICCPNSRRTIRADRPSSGVCGANGSQEAAHMLRMTEMFSDGTQLMPNSPKRSIFRTEQFSTYQYSPGKRVADNNDHSPLQLNEAKSVNFGNECKTQLLFSLQASISTAFPNSPTHWMSRTNGVSASVNFPQVNRSSVEPLRLSTPKHDLSPNAPALVIYNDNIPMFQPPDGVFQNYDAENGVSASSDPNNPL